MDLKKLKIGVAARIPVKYNYVDAGENAQPEVKEAIQRFRALPEEKRDQVLLYWLLGEGTPDYKMPQDEAKYTDEAKNEDTICGNCEFAYQEVVTGKYICSKISGEIKLSGWCKFWKKGN